MAKFNSNPDSFESKLLNVAIIFLCITGIFQLVSFIILLLPITMQLKIDF